MKNILCKITKRNDGRYDIESFNDSSYYHYGIYSDELADIMENITKEFKENKQEVVFEMELL